jgi:hypothetical protein
MVLLPAIVRLPLMMTKLNTSIAYEQSSKQLRAVVQKLKTKQLTTSWRRSQSKMHYQSSLNWIRMLSWKT